MSKGTVEVPEEIWTTVFACFAGHVGIEMQHRSEMPESWANAFRFHCADDVLERLGIPLRASKQGEAA